LTQESLTGFSRTAHPIAYALAATSAALMIFTVAKAALPASVGSVAAAEAPAPVDPPVVAQPVRMVSAFSFSEPVADYPVISPFGLRQLPWEEHGRLHAGVDIAAPAGTAVRAVAHGVVLRAGQDGGYGRFVEVRHAGGLTSLYAHLGSIDPAMKPGRAILNGVSVGSIGNSGSSTGAHLHFEIRDRKGHPLNPQMFMGQQFASADELPLKAASRFPRRTRVAYVSFIPKSKRELMEAREAEKEEAKLAAQEAKLQAEQARKLAAALRATQVVAVNTPPAIVIEPGALAEPKVSTDSKGRVHATFGAAS
jgi:hypothetical protein